MLYKLFWFLRIGAMPLFAANADDGGGGNGDDAKDDEDKTDDKGAGDGANDGGKGGGDSPYKGKSAEDLLKLLAEKDGKIHDLNKESAERRRKLQAFEKDAKERADKELSAAQKAEKESAELKTANENLRARLRNQAIEMSVADIARRLNFVSAKQAYKLADLSKIEYDEDSGEVTGVEDALKALAKAEPNLIASNESDKDDGKGDIDASKRGAGGKGGRSSESLRRRFGLRLTPNTNSK